MSSTRPTLFIPHGGGPCFFMDWPSDPRMWDRMADFLRQTGEALRPRAILVVSGHWEEDAFTTGATAQPAEPRPASSTGTATLVYSTTTEDDRGAGPLGEEPAVRDEELLSSIDEQLSTLDTLDDDQRDATR